MLRLIKKVSIFKRIFDASANLDWVWNLLDFLAEVELRLSDSSWLAWSFARWRHIDGSGLNDRYGLNYRRRNDWGRKVLNWLCYFSWNLEAASLLIANFGIIKDSSFQIIETWEKFLEGLFELHLELVHKIVDMSGNGLLLLSPLNHIQALVHVDPFVFFGLLDALVSDTRYFSHIITWESNIENSLCWLNIICLW